MHGQPGTGKTAFALQVAAQCGFPCLYVTCEMAPLELLRRHTARVTRTYLNRFKSGELSPRESLELARRWHLIWPSWMPHAPGQTRPLCRSASRGHKNTGPMCAMC